MVPVVAGLAMAYCVCTLPMPVESHELVSMRLDGAVVYDSSSRLSTGSPWCGSNGTGVEHYSWQASLPLHEAFPQIWALPRLHFFHPPSAFTVELSAFSVKLEADEDEGYSLGVDGCACARPVNGPERLSLGTLRPPNIVPPNESGEVPPQITEMAGERAARELRRAWYEVIGKRASDETVLLLASHWAHETSGGRFMYNYNFGGIKGRGASGLSCLREAHEGWGWTATRRIDRFRAYRSASEGAVDYVSLLARKYPIAIEAASSGDILQFVSALRESGYFTGSESAYALSLIELAERGQRSGFNALRIGAHGGNRVTNTSSQTALR